MRAIVCLSVALALLVPSATEPLVYLHLSIKDKNRIFVRDLKVDEIQITVDGVPQEIEHMFVDQVPTLYAILVDTGPPMAPPMRHPLYPTLLERVQHFVMEVLDRHRETDSYLLGTYYHKVKWLVEPTSDVVTLERAVRAIEPGEERMIPGLREGSNAGDAMEETIRRMRRRGESRRVILLFGHTVDQKSIEQVPRLKDLLADNAIDLYVVSLAPKVSGAGFSFELRQTPFFYQSLVARTGGELYDYGFYEDRLHRQVGDYVARLHTLWTVAFRLRGLEPAERPRKVEVTIRRPTSQIEYKKEIVY